MPERGSRGRFGTGGHPGGPVDREIYFFEEYGCYVVRWLADITLEGTLGHWRSLLADERHRPGLGALHDGRGRSPKFSWKELREGARSYREAVEPAVGFGPVALLLDRGKLFREASRGVSLLELEGALVTDSERDAKECVGLPSDFRLPYEVSGTAEQDGVSAGPDG